MTNLETLLFQSDSDLEMVAKEKRAAKKSNVNFKVHARHVT